MVGFNYANKQEQKIEKKEKNLIQEVDKEYAAVLDQLDELQHHISREQIIEEKIRKELVNLHQEILAIENIFVKRNNLHHAIAGSGSNHPENAIKDIEQIQRMDTEIIRRAETVERELQRFMIPESNELVKMDRLDEKGAKHVRSVANTLLSKLHFLSNAARQQASGPEYYENWKKQFRQVSPSGPLGYHN